MKKITKVLLITLTVLILIPTLYANSCFIEAQKLMNLEPISKKVDEYTEKAEYIPFDEINKDFVNAVVATEDKRFFTRKGFDGSIIQKQADKNAGKAIFFIFVLFVLKNTARHAAIWVKLAGKIEATIKDEPVLVNSISPNVIKGQCKPKITNG